jgi:uncharacterized protein (TIGR02466 family)
MQIQPIFNNFLAAEFLDIDNNALSIYCKEKYKEQQELNPSLGCFLDLSAAETKPLMDAINQTLGFLHRDLGFIKEARQEITSAWINVNNNPLIDGAHSHGGFFFSGVYYVKSDQNSGCINFLNPNREVVSTFLPSMTVAPNSFNCATIRHPPFPGKLLIFPSWLIHYVEHNLGDSDRISIAFNTKIVMPDEISNRYIYGWKAVS